MVGGAIGFAGGLLTLAWALRRGAAGEPDAVGAEGSHDLEEG
jgi:hypothetical protein